MQKPLLNRLLTDDIMGLKTTAAVIFWLVFYLVAVLSFLTKFLRKENL